LEIFAEDLEIYPNAIKGFHRARGNPLGKAFSTVGDIIPPSTGAFHPNDAIAGYEKGLACNVNLIRDLKF